MRGLRATFKSISLLLIVACSGSNQQSIKPCSKTTSLIKTETFSSLQIENASTALLLTSHIDFSDDNYAQPLGKNEVMRQCNASLELLQAEPPKIRIWTASHCIKPLLLTKLSLAVRDKASEKAEYYAWNLQHSLLQNAILMRDAYDKFAGLLVERERLARAFDRRKMVVGGNSAALAPRTVCENLRWSLQADSRHSLCFSIFDLVNIDADLPEPQSGKSQALVEALQKVQPASRTLQEIAHKRETFLRRIHLTSQTEWLIHEGFRVQKLMTDFALNIFPFFSGDILEIEKLNRTVFSLPHPEESSMLVAQSYTTQDAIPPAVNETYLEKSHGTYTSSRTTISQVNVTCYRQLRKYNAATGKVDVVPQLEPRPYEYCPGGSKFQPDHFWNRDRPWSEMIADMTVGAAQEYTKTIFDLSQESSDTAERLNRFSVSSSFGVNHELGFDNLLADLSAPFLRHLRVPASAMSPEIFGLDQVEETGAFLLSLPIAESNLRFLKGDSGSILMLDGVPIATLYSVDGEETSGGSSILSLPESIDEDSTPSSGNSSGRSIRRRPASELPLPASDQGGGDAPDGNREPVAESPGQGGGGRQQVAVPTCK